MAYGRYIILAILALTPVKSRLAHFRIKYVRVFMTKKSGDVFSRLSKFGE